MEYNQFIILLFSIIFYVNGTFQNNAPTFCKSLRNNILRKIILDDTNRAKFFIQKTKILYNKILSKYYEINEKYYSLSETERTTIETIISFSY